MPPSQSGIFLLGRLRRALYFFLQSFLLYIGATVVLSIYASGPPLPKVRIHGQIIPYGALAYSMQYGMVVPLPVTVKTVLNQRNDVKAKKYRNPKNATQSKLFGKKLGVNITNRSSATARAVANWARPNY